jgi:hypothetical protein
VGYDPLGQAFDLIVFIARGAAQPPDILQHDMLRSWPREE